MVTLASQAESNTINWLKFICAIMVVMIHIPGSPLLTNNDQISSLYILARRSISRGICETAVPTFYVISAYLFYTKFTDWKWSVYYEKIKKRFRTLFVPYILWNAICIACVFAIHILKHLLLNSDLTSLFHFCSERGWGLMFWNCARYGSSTWYGLCGKFILATPYDWPLWFIRDLFILCLCSPAIFFLVKILKERGVILFSCLYILGIGGQVEGLSIEGLTFFYIGAYIRLYEKSIADYYTRYKHLIIVFSSILLISLCLIPEDYQFRSFVVRAYKLFGSAALFLMVHLLVKSNPAKTIPSFLSGSTFFIYAGHCFGFRPYFNVFIQRAIPLSHPEWYYLIIPIIIIGLVFIVYYLTNRFFPKVSRLLSGGRN